MTLEPPGLDPTAGAASATTEIVLYNIFATLTKVNGDGHVTPLVAESWSVSPDARTYTFKLRMGVKFQNGEPSNAASAKFLMERAAAKDSVNKDKAVFANIAATDTPAEHTVVLTLKNSNPDLLFQLGPATAVMVEPKSVADNNTQPVGTGPYRLEAWNRGSRAKTILAINYKRNPLDDVRVRRAIAAAIEHKAAIDGAADGFGVPIGSYYTPGAPGEVDLTAMNAYDRAKARALLHQAGISLPLELTMKLPPTPCARQGGEVIAAMLDKVGIKAKMENIEWAQWLSGVYKDKAYDLTVIAHVEPLDCGNFSRPGYYWVDESAQFNELWSKIQAIGKADERNKLMGDTQRLMAEDAVAACLYQPTWITVANARLKGLWKDVPAFANDIGALSWQ